LLRISNITKQGTIDERKLVFLSDDKARALASTQVEPGDLVVSQRGTLGIPAVVPARYPKWNISANLIAVSKPTGMLPRYIQAFLSCRLGAKQLERAQSGQVQGKITTEDVACILIPDVQGQQVLVTNLDKARSARDGKLAQADALLDGIDDLVLAELGLVAPKKDGRFIFAVRLGELKTRCDADYQCPRFRALRKSIEAGKHSVGSVKDLCRRIESGFAAGRQDQAEDQTDGVPHIRPLNITGRGQLTFDGTKYVPRASVKPGDMLAKGEVLFNNTNSTEWVGKTTVFPGGRDCACSNHITRLAVDESRVLPAYLAALFNALRGLGLFGLLSTNFNNQAGINAATLGDLRVPVPPLSLQRKVVAIVAQRYVDADRLRAEAAALWAKALEDFERKLLAKGEKGGSKA